MKHFFKQLAPFVLAGVAMVAFAFGIVLLAYLLLFGAIVGFVLFALSWIKQTFFTPKKAVKIHKSGRIIDSNDWKRR